MTTTSSLPDTGLLPCPFCGGAMQFRKALWPSDGNTDAIIHAQPAECPLSDFSNATIDESIIAEWNTRALATPTQCEGQAPVAWLVAWRYDCSECSRVFDREASALEWGARLSADQRVSGCAVVPLYATPTQGQPAAVAEALEAAAKIVDAEAERILSKQTPTTGPLSIADTINLNLRMMANCLPEISASIRALTRSVKATEATINNPLSDSRVGVEAGEQVSPGFVMVPMAAWKWLFGEAPAPDGKWFGDHEDDYTKPGRIFPRKYWWRSKFRELCAPPSAPGVGK